MDFFPQEMGLGKTLQALLILGYDHFANPSIFPSLVLCPPSVMFHWSHEISKFLPDGLMKPIVYHAQKKKREK